MTTTATASAPPKPSEPRKLPTAQPRSRTGTWWLYRGARGANGCVRTSDERCSKCDEFHEWEMDEDGNWDEYECTERCVECDEEVPCGCAS